jgi:hypothetical protein
MYPAHPCFAWLGGVNNNRIETLCDTVMDIKTQIILILLSVHNMAKKSALEVSLFVDP